MRVVIIRHGKVDFTWRKRSTSEQFNEDCKRYDEAPILPLLPDATPFAYSDIYISSLSRTKATAEQLFGKEDLISTGFLDEVPLCASLSSNQKLPLLFWNVSGRLQWLFNIHTQKECRRETLYRAKQFVEMILKEGNNCIVVTHGFFMHTLIHVMKKQGFQITHTKLSYANGERMIAER